MGRTKREWAETQSGQRRQKRRAKLRRLKLALTWDYGLIISIPIAFIAYAHILFNPGTLDHWMSSLPVTTKVSIVVVFYTTLLLAFRRAVMHTQTSLESLEDTRSSLDAAIELQRLLAKVSSRFTDEPAGRLEEEVAASLAQIGSTLPRSHLALLTLSPETDSMDQLLEWSNEKTEALPYAEPGTELPWLCEMLRKGESFRFRSLSDFPKQAKGERKLFANMGVKSGLLYPLTHGSAGEGFLGLLSRANGREWNMSELELLAGLLSSVIERSDTEEALRQSEARFQGIIQVASDAIISVDHNSRILIFNHGAEEMFGFRAAAMIGSSFETLLPKASVKAHRSYVEGFLKSEVTARRIGRNGEIVARRHNGEEFAAEATISKLETRETSTVLTYMMRDVSSRKTAEQEKTRLESRLRQAQKMEAMGGLAGGIAHDFNNLLGAMIGNTELAMTRIGEDEKLKINLQRVMQAGYRATRLVKQILTFSRVNDADRKPVDVAKVVEEALALVQSSLPAMIHVRKDIDASVDRVLSEETQVHQMIMNLCTNAYHAIGERGGTLGVSARNFTADSDFVADHPDMELGPYVHITVSDTGCGMDEATKTRIFEPFFTTKPVGKGTGMGLSVIHGIVMKYGGQIMLDSVPGQGTQVHVYLPACDDDVEQAAPHQDVAVDPSKHAGVRILLVDDEVNLIETTQEILQQLGYSVTALADPVEALKRFRESPKNYDVVITDQAMPNLSGADMAKQMMDVRPELPVIIATGYSETVTPENALAMGMKAYVSKPYRVQDLTSALKIALATSADQIAAAE